MYLVSQDLGLGLYALFPEAYLCFGLLWLVLVTPFLHPSERNWVSSSLILVCAGLLLSAVLAPFETFGPLASNEAASACKGLVVLAFFGLFVLDLSVLRSSISALILLAFGLLGAVTLFSSQDWLMVFLALEILSLSSYCLIALPGTPKSMEAVIKYFTAGAIATSLILLGVFILVLERESVSLDAFPSSSIAALFTVVVTSGLLIKIGAAPFHYWVADAYEGAPALATVFLSVAVKLTFFLFVCKVLFGPLWLGSLVWRPVLALCAGFSMVIGCFGALFQKRVKRLLAYSSINNVGFALASLSTGSVTGLEAALTYMGLYCATLFFVFVLLLGFSGPRPITYVSDMVVLRSHPTHGVLGALSLFSLAGIPPLSGFWTKLFVLQELVGSCSYVLAGVAAACSVIGSFYYLSLVRALYFESKTSNYPDRTISFSLCILSTPIFLYPLAPNFVSSWSVFFAAILAGQ